jgi:protein-S-isoprenylcysteine O-methyltransferase Ste14
MEGQVYFLMKHEAATIIFIIFLCLLVLIRSVYKLRYNHLISIKAFHYEPLWLILIRYIFGLLLMAATIFRIFIPEYFISHYPVLPVWLQIAGMPIAFLSLILLLASHQALGDNFSTSIDTERTHEIIMRGPYRFIRHPMYVAYLFFFAGLFLISRSLVFGISGILIILSLMILRLPYEEKALTEKYPDIYSEYKTRTGAFIPKIRHLPK